MIAKNMVSRTIEGKLLSLSRQYPVITITGPPQSGKTTQTLNSGLFKGLDFYKKLNPDNKKSVLVYTGREKTNRYGHECLPFWSV